MELLTKQSRLQRTIDRSLDNFRKVGRGNLTAAKIRSRIATLKENWEQFQAGHDTLTQGTDTAQQAKLDYFKERHYDATEEDFLAALDYMSDCLEEIEPVVSPNQSFASSHSRPDASGFSLSHLPPIRLPPFNGNVEEWEQFRDRFTALIRNNRKLNDFARMHFLSSCLKGSALDTIANLAVTADNFEIAWRALTSRYENKRRSLNLHLSTLINLTSITRESASELQILLDRVNVAVASLRSLNRSPEDLWNDILVHLITQKLDPITRKAWNLKESDRDVPSSFDEFNKFLRARTRALEEFLATTAKSTPRTQQSSRVHTASAVPTSKSACPLCNSSHFINICPAFTSKNAHQRREIVKQKKRCFNCLSAKHAVHDCTSKYSCRFCQQRHHSLLHVDSNFCSNTTQAVSTSCSVPQPIESHSDVTSLLAAHAKRARAQVLLATAWVTVRASSGRKAVVRALLDQGSEVTFISESLAQTLHAQRVRISMSVSAVGGIHAGHFRSATQIWISPRGDLTPSFGTTALIMKSLTSYAPKPSIEISSFSYLSDLSLADADPTSSDPIHIIIGADIYNDLIIEGVCKGEQGQPLAQNSVLGWIISGPVRLSKFGSGRLRRASTCSIAKISAHHLVESSSLLDEIHRFWETEDIPTSSILTPQEAQCEPHFSTTHYRDLLGRYIVRLPFKAGPPIDIGLSRVRAEKLLNTLARKLRTNPGHETECNEFLAEYERLGHMKSAPTSRSQTEQTVYLPYHTVIREGSATTHLRVVFNASSLTSNGTSLNDHLHAGPKLQHEITSVILQWRRHRFAYSADIAKMYRQIRLDPRDYDYQRIIWRPSLEEEPRDYQLLTVTYGMTCAPYLALRVLKQLTIDEGPHFPLAVAILNENIYVDDILFGADDKTKLIQMRDQLTSLLGRGGFELKKWASNAESLLSDIDDSNHGLACNKHLSPDDQIKILGIVWSPASDNFEFQAALTTIIPNSKRSILSAIAKFYDPLGWVTPVTVAAKAFFQQLWRKDLGWDEKLSDELFSRWKGIYSRLSELNGLRIPRWIGLGLETRSAELHGFSDASNFAYAAAVYLRVASSSGNVTVTLLAGKSKVAPIKPLSIPRLELSGALLLAKLLEFIRRSPGFEATPCHCWTDSTVVLAWVTQHPSRWKTFVANRVNEIQSRLVNVEWHHVSTHDNPADCASRGMFGDEIEHHDLWWHGPAWLQLSPNEWPHEEIKINPEDNQEEKIVVLQCSQQCDDWDMSSRYSSWPRLLRVTAYLFKFIHSCREKRKGEQPRTIYPVSGGMALTASECQRAKIFWIGQIQSELFHNEIKALSEKGSISAKSPIQNLNPFLDKDGILRVGGRLSKAPAPFTFKHPILLSSHRLVTLIVRQAHLRALHAGPQLTLNVLRRDFWILRARNIVKSIIHGCVACARERATIPTQLMGDLPEMRVSSSSRCFLHCGIDYAGPVHIRGSAGRGVKCHKAYIALFICLATKAIHLELISDYSTPSFLNAYSAFALGADYRRRFIPITEPTSLERSAK